MKTIPHTWTLSDCVPREAAVSATTIPCVAHRTQADERISDMALPPEDFYLDFPLQLDHSYIHKTCKTLSFRIPSQKTSHNVNPSAARQSIAHCIATRKQPSGPHQSPPGTTQMVTAEFRASSQCAQPDPAGDTRQAALKRVQTQG